MTVLLSFRLPSSPAAFEVGKRSKSVSDTCVPATSSSLLRLLEISQIRRSLAFLGRHQQAIGAQHVALRADKEVIVVLGTIDFAPEWLRIWFATVVFHHGPRTRQRVVP